MQEATRQATVHAPIGKRFEGRPETVERKDTVAFAHATNDPNPTYVSGDDVIAPMMFPVRPLLAVCGRAVLDKEVKVDLLRLVHGEQEMIFHHTLEPGDEITPVATILDLEDKGSGHLLKIGQQLVRDGIVVTEAVSGYFIRRRGGGGKKTAPPIEAPAAEPLLTATWTMDEDQSIRYAAASLDRNPIHVDMATAQAAGLPGIIAHGLCTLAMSVRELINGLADGEPTRLQRIKVRFTKPVLPGQTLTTVAWLIEQTDTERTVGFETRNSQGQIVLSQAMAVFAR
jgi:acyl dehydratase